MAKVTVFPDAVVHCKDDLAHAYHTVNGPIILGALKRNTPVYTGLLQGQTVLMPLRLLGVKNQWLLRFKAQPSQGFYVQKGHGVIVPRVAKALRFVTKGGVVVFARRVRAVKPNEYMLRTFQELGFRPQRRKG